MQASGVHCVQQLIGCQPPEEKNMHVCFRVDDELAKLAQEKAAKEGTTVSQLMRQALVIYVTRKKK